MTSSVYGAQYGAKHTAANPQNTQQAQNRQTQGGASESNATQRSLSANTESTNTGSTSTNVLQQQLTQFFNSAQGQQLLQILRSLLAQIQGQQSQGGNSQAGNTAQASQTTGTQGGGTTATDANGGNTSSKGSCHCRNHGQNPSTQADGGAPRTQGPAQQPQAPTQNPPAQPRQPENPQPQSQQPQRTQTPQQQQPAQRPEPQQAERRETEETTRETAMMGTGAFKGQKELLDSWIQAHKSGKTEEWDNKHWSDIAKHSSLGGATIKEENGKRYIHVSPNSSESSRWVKEHGPSKHNPEGLPIKISPVAIDLNQNGQIDVTGQSTAKDAKHSELGRTVNFDLDGDGAKEQVEWLKGTGDGMLVDNRDGNAAEDMSGARLFGDQGGTFNNGYEKMQRLDQNQDGVLNGNELEGLEVWVDDGDAVVEAGEMKSLADVGITELSARHSDVQNERGETLMQADASRADGSTLLTEDVWFGKQA